MKNPVQKLHARNEQALPPCDPRPGMSKKSSASASAAQLLLGRGRRAAAADESIEFFSALRDCQTDRPHASVQTGEQTGKVRRSGGELLSPEIGKNDYDWLLTPPATPLRSPATSGAAGGSTAALNRLTRATSASYAKSNSPHSLTRRGNGNPTSRLARSSSASATHSSVNASATVASSRRLPHVRTLSSASSSSSIIAASNASGSSTPLASAATSPRTPAHARSTARSRPWDVKAHAPRVPAGSAVGQQRKAPSSNSSGLSSAPPTSARPRATTGATNPRSTTVTSRQPDLTRRGANAVARSRLARHSTAGSTALGASHAPHVVRPSIKPGGPVSAAVKQCHGNGMAAASMATQRWRSSPSSSPSAAAAALECAPRRDLPPKRSSMNGDGRKINVEKAMPHHTTVLAAAAAKRTGNENVGRQYKNAGDGGTPASLKHTVHHRSIRSAASGGRLGFMAATYDGGSISGGRSTSKKGKPNGTAAAAAAAASRLAKPDAFPSTRYDAMLLREDPKNLTWLNGCGVDSDYDCSSGGAGLVEGSLEPFDVPVAGMEGTAVRI